MGFSASGSVVVVLLGLFVALSTFHTAGANTMERLSAAEADQTDRFDAVAETRVTVTSVSLSGTSDSCDVTVAVNNTGSTELALNDTTFLIESDVQTDWRAGADVNGDSDTGTWLPGERLTATRTGYPERPDSVSIVTKTGVAARRDLGDRTCS